MLFKSKKDIWMGIVIWSLIIVFSYLLYQATFVLMRALDSMIMFAMLVTLVSVWFNTKYKIEDDKLLVTFGIATKSINIEDITSIRKTKNPFVAPKLSAKSLEINYEKYQTIQVSPKDIDKFIKELQKINPNIKINN